MTAMLRTAGFCFLLCLAHTQAADASCTAEGCSTLSDEAALVQKTTLLHQQKPEVADTDHDGTISAAELNTAKAMAKSVLQQVDKDFSGSITKDELLAYMSNMYAAQVSTEGVEAIVEQLMQSFDKNSDRTLHLEAEAVANAPAFLEATQKGVDAQAAAHTERTFQKLDANADGSVTLAEMDSFLRDAAGNPLPDKYRHGLFDEGPVIEGKHWQTDANLNGRLEKEEVMKDAPGFMRMWAEVQSKAAQNTADEYVGRPEHDDYSAMARMYATGKQQEELTFRGLTKRAFEKLDANADGSVTPAEMASFVEKTQGKPAADDFKDGLFKETMSVMSGKNVLIDTDLSGGLEMKEVMKDTPRFMRLLAQVLAKARMN